jgi:hypothetical protein
MAAVQPLGQLVGLPTNKLTREENLIVEIELLTRIYEELREYIKIQQQDYFRLLKLNEEMESAMLDGNLIRHLINDILVTEEYSVEGIASYTGTSEDVIFDVVAGKNLAPSLPLSHKLISLHKSVRPRLYQDIMKKIATEYLA